jgi:hypothetical protein
VAKNVKYRSQEEFLVATNVTKTQFLVAERYFEKNKDTVFGGGTFF